MKNRENVFERCGIRERSGFLNFWQFVELKYIWLSCGSFCS